MVRFQFLPAETQFYDWFEKATANLLDAAQQLQDLFDHYDDVENRVIVESVPNLLELLQQALKHAAFNRIRRNKIKDQAIEKDNRERRLRAHPGVKQKSKGKTVSKNLSKKQVCNRQACPSPCRH